MTGGGRRLALLAYLFLQPSSVTRDQLCDLLWDPQPGKDSQHRLRELLSDTRRVLPPGVLLTEDRSVTVDRAGIACDVVEFRRAASEGRLADAASIYQANFMAGCSPRGAPVFGEWVDEIGRQLKREHVHVLTALVDAYQESENYDLAAQWAERLWIDDPDNARHAGAYIETRSLAGDRPAALTAAAAVESHFVEHGLTIPRNLQKLLATAKAIESRVFASAIEQVAQNQRTRSPEDNSVRERLLFGTLKIRTVRYTIGTAALALLGLFAFVPRQPAQPKATQLFGGGGTLVFKTAGVTRALRFVGPKASDTVAVTLPFADSLFDWQLRFPPARNAIAFECEIGGTDDREVCVRSLVDGSTWRVVGHKGDDYADGWSPDGSWLLVHSGRDSKGENYNYEAYAVEPISGRTVRISNDPFETIAIGSPDGSRIAVIARGAQGDSVVVRTVDGNAIEGYRVPGEVVLEWSPDGRKLLVVDRGGDWEAYTIVPPNNRERIATTLATVYAGAWSPDNSAIALNGIFEDSAKLIVCRIGHCGSPDLQIKGVSHVLWIPRRPHAFLHKIKVLPDSARMQAGEQLQLSVLTTDQRGNRYSAPYLHVTLQDSSSAWLDSAMVLHATKPGVAKVVASAGGWRADTLTILVTAPRTKLLFEETWETGLDTVRWKLYGSPLPTVVSRQANNVFRNNGDDHYPSGAVTNSRFNLAGGITFEWRQKTPITGLYWQEIWIDFTEAAAESFVTGEGDPFPGTPARITIRAPIPVYHPTNPKLQASCETDFRTWNEMENYPVRLQDSTWHDFAFQLHPDGRCELIVDGQIIVSHATPLFVDPQKQYSLSVGGRTYKTDILIDDIRLWRGIRWARTKDGRAVMVAR
ncbi:MAG: hypothetical protein ACT4O1_00605 [Gemmatimonadota bacterium]